MIDLLYEYIYKKESGYTFKDQLYYNNNKKLVYCFVAKKGRNIECLLQNFKGFTNAEKDNVINDYLECKAKSFAK